MDKENVSPQHSEEPVKKKSQFSLSLKKNRRFGESVSGNLHDLIKPVVPDNSKRVSHGLRRILTSGNKRKKNTSPRRFALVTFWSMVHGMSKSLINGFVSTFMKLSIQTVSDIVY